ncbi:MAG: pirin family protein [Treponema sp.]|nr:pirin family protein [Treponema sp.]
MTRRIPVEAMHRSREIEWLESIFHFSFAGYYNKNNMNFGVLRVVNDDVIREHSGFETHPHNDMEIVSYMVRGALTHRDSLGNASTIRRGAVQYMSAGSGILHSEINEGDEEVRLLQIWIRPDVKNAPPAYGDYKFPWEGRRNKLLHIAGSKNGNAPVKLNQDVNMYALELDSGNTLDVQVAHGRQCYIVQIEGSSDINGITLNERDAMETAQEPLRVTTQSVSHLLFIEMGLSAA